MNEPKPKVIFTCFAGRKRNMELMLMYTDKLHGLGLVDEMHIWDFSKDKEDSKWLSETFQKAPLLSLPDYNYSFTGIKLYPGKTASLAFRCRNDAHVLLLNSDGTVAAEISLGAYNNSCSFLRSERQGHPICSKGGGVCDEKTWTDLDIRADETGTIAIKTEGSMLLEGKLENLEFPLELKVAGWGPSETWWLLPDRTEHKRKHPYARLFPVANKNSWTEYYRHYTSQIYPNHVIIKSDDDIVFLDVKSFERFMKQRSADKKSVLMFPNIVNNGVCAGHQYSMGYLGDKLGEFKKEGVMGRLWGDGRLCADVHRHFIKEYDSWMDKSRGQEEICEIPIGNRISINFFAILSDDLFVYQMIGHDDEKEITTEVTEKLGRGHSISMNMTVSHLAFYRQRETGLDEIEILGMYKNLALRELS